MYRVVTLLLACLALLLVTSFNAQSVAEQPTQTQKAESQPKELNVDEVFNKIADWVAVKSPGSTFTTNRDMVTSLRKKLASLKEVFSSRESEEMFFQRFSSMRRTVANAVFAEVSFIESRSTTNNSMSANFFAAQKTQLIAEGQSSIDQLFAAREQESSLRVVRLQQGQALELVTGNMVILFENLNNLSLTYVMTKITEAHAKVDAALQISATKKSS